MKKIRGFEVVADAHRVHVEEVKVGKAVHRLPYDIIIPMRADIGSAGYDFYAPCEITVLPDQVVNVWTDVKAYMQDGEVLLLYPRSSLGSQGLTLANSTGIIDSSYYGNAGNDGNIGVPLKNNSGRAIIIEEGERFVQGMFTHYLVSDNGNPDASIVRSGGYGSSGR